MCIGTRPETPSTMRTSSTALVRIGMKSTIRTTPSSVWNVVSSTSVSPWYCRSTRWTPPAGASCQRPWSAVPRSEANTAPESNRGTHSQSIDPSRPTRAAVWVSPMSA